MHIESVTAHAFGPLAGQTLTLAPGMTVLIGGNESTKSSWHAAIYAGLCGRRRSRGRAPKDDQLFADLHKPWGGSAWRVSAAIVLDDGRSIELDHDLAGRVSCSAVDELGRDVADEILFEGSPDGCRLP